MTDPSHLRTADGTFPNPSDPLDAQWALRYGTPTEAQRMWAASVIHAYSHLLTHPARQDRTFAAMRRATKEVDRD